MTMKVILITFYIIIIYYLSLFILYHYLFIYYFKMSPFCICKISHVYLVVKYFIDVKTTHYCQKKQY